MRNFGVKIGSWIVGVSITVLTTQGVIAGNLEGNIIPVPTASNSDSEIVEITPTPTAIKLSQPTLAPTAFPTLLPSPTIVPTVQPTVGMTITPAPKPTVKPTPTPVPTKKPTPSPGPTILPTPTPSTKYKNGNYSSDGTYTTNGGLHETIGVTVTVTNDSVTAVTVTNKATNPTSSTFQNRFIAGIQAAVVGKTLDASATIGKVGGASDTTTGFKTAITAIKAKAL